jgi:putative serine protease PepD
VEDDARQDDVTEPVWRIARPADADVDVPRVEPPAADGPRVEATRPIWQYEPTPPAPQPPPHGPSRALSVFLAAVLGAVLGTGATLVATHHGVTSAGTVQVAPPVAAPSAGSDNFDVASVARAVLPSIVRIDVSGQGALGQSQEGTGSGVIYTSDGYIVTNNHVVEGESSFQVTLADGTQLPARVIGTAAPAVDIAVIKVDKTGMHAAVFGSTSAVEVGQLAVAIGSPFGLQGSVTAGVISALHRNISLDPTTRFTDAIQTDAPINPGNSGGALADSQGRVVGINTAILSGGSGGSVGVGFAIPVDIVRKVADQIIRTGHAQLPFLGVSGQNTANGAGALIQDVVPGGPAASAGIKAGDIIVSIDGKAITSMDDLVSVLLQKDVGQVVRIEFIRGGGRHSTSARLSSRPEG